MTLCIPFLYFFIKNQGDLAVNLKTITVRFLDSLLNPPGFFLPFFSIFFHLQAVFRANRWSGSAGNVCIGKSAFFSLKWCIFDQFLINFFFTIFSNNALLKSDTTFLS